MRGVAKIKKMFEDGNTGVCLLPLLFLQLVECISYFQPIGGIPGLFLQL